jgi:hypothetical protein
MGRPPKNQENKPNYSALNAERAYKILSEIQIGDKTLFDMIFDMNKGDDILGNFEKISDEKRVEFGNMLTRLQQSSGDERNIVVIDMMKKFPEVITKNGNKALEIKKVLIQNSEKAKELSELFTGSKTEDFREAVGNALSYIMFLAEV